MLKREIKVGSTYVIDHSSGLIEAKIIREKEAFIRGGRNGTRSMTHWIAINGKTGREIEIKSAAKMLREVVK